MTKLFIAVLVCSGLPLVLCGQTSLRTFTSKNGVFRLKYSTLLTHCTARKQLDRYTWVPEDSCEAYFPVCDDPSDEDSSTLLCIAYPKAKFKDSPAFEAATFSVAEIMGAVTEKDCSRASPDWNMPPQKMGRTINIHGIRFSEFDVSDAGTSQVLQARVYRNLHSGTCYELSVRMATADSVTFDPPGKEFTVKDRNNVNRRLNQALESFRFLK